MHSCLCYLGYGLRKEQENNTEVWCCLIIKAQNEFCCYKSLTLLVNSIL
uniref:Uncharacterized protein n=1 Tax=Anguilla anguilla TaxID=7936 RepID=A0A0E9VRG2_ANGAN